MDLIGFFDIIPFSEELSKTLHEENSGMLHEIDHHNDLQDEGGEDGNMMSNNSRNVSPTMNNYILPVHGGDVLTFGRNRKLCNVVVNHPATSQIHCKIWPVQFDSSILPLVFLRDSSRNRTLFNGEEVRKNNCIFLSDGDLLEIRSAITLVFHSVENISESFPVYFNSSINSWHITDKILGKGSFGAVHVARKKGEKQLFAVKIIGIGVQKKEQQRRLQGEAAVLQKIRHVCMRKFGTTLIFLILFINISAKYYPDS